MALNAEKKYMILKWFAAAMVLSALFLMTLTWYLGVKLKPIVTAELKELVLKTTDQLYRIEFSDVSVNALSGTSSLKDVRILPDTAVYRRMIATQHAPNNLYRIKLKKLVVRNFHPWRLWRHKKLDIDLLLFDRPDIEMRNRQFDFNEDKQPRPKKSPYDYISKYLRALRIHTIDFKDASFRYINDNNLENPVVDRVDHLNVTLKDWLIDANSAEDKSRIYLLKDVIINLKDYSYPTPDSLYHINFGQLDFAASTGKLGIKRFSVAPRSGEQSFGSALGYAKDRYSIQINDVDFNGLNLPLYILKQELYAKEMTIANGAISVVNDNTLPKKAEDKTGKYPHQLLQQTKGKLTIEKLALNNIDLSYSEFDQDGKNKGIITFEHTWGTIANVTNVEKAKASNHLMTADLTSQVMGNGKLNVNFKFDLTAKDGAFSYSGSLVNMEGKALNRMTKPLGLVKVNSGHIDRLQFAIKANDRVAEGEMSFAYRDLSVALLKKVEGEDRLVKKGLMSILANALVIHSDNPNAKGEFIKAPIANNRVATASFFNFIWKTLFQGVKYSIGLSPQKESEIRSRISAFEKRKADRQERIKRRAQRTGAKRG